MNTTHDKLAAGGAAKDLELLEMAAKATGNEFHSGHITVNGQQFEWAEWNPLVDDGDALRLAVKLGIGLELDLQFEHVYAIKASLAIYQDTGSGGDLLSATRRAIVRAAAEIGRTSPTPSTKARTDALKGL